MGVMCSFEEISYSWVLKITVSKAKAMEKARPMSRLNSIVAVQVNNHNTWEKGKAYLSLLNYVTSL